MKIETLKEAKQAAFNGAVKGLASQGWKHCSRGGDCRWNLGKPGLHCAIGWLIPWEEQRDVPPKFQVVSRSWERLAPELRPWANGAGEDNATFRNFLERLQSEHDDAHIDHMRSDFEQFGRDHGLVWPKSVP